MSYRSKNGGYTGYQNKSRLGTEAKVAVLIFCMAGLLIATLGYWYVTANKALVVLDEKSLCPVDGAFGTTVVILDLSDELSYLQEQKLRNFFTSKDGITGTATISVLKHDRLRVYLLDESASATLPAPIIDICNPGNGEGLSTLTSSPALVQKRYVQAYKQPLQEALIALMQASPSNTTPLIESIRGVALTSFVAAPKEGHLNKLILVSDMLQHTDTVSHYRGDQKIAIEGLSKLRADLGGVDEVHIRMFERKASKQLQGKSILTFWNDYFKVSGSVLSSAERWAE